MLDPWKLMSRPSEWPVAQEVRQHLVPVGVVKLLHRLEFNNNATLNQQVHLPLSDADFLVLKLDGHLSRKLEIAEAEFHGHRISRTSSP